MILVCGLVFLIACMPNAMGCYLDIKPGSCPNSINVDSNGIVTIAIQDSSCSPDNVDIYLEQKVNGTYYILEKYEGVEPERYEYFSDFVLSPCPGTTTYTEDVYVVKFRTQDLSSGLNLDKYVDGYDNLYIEVKGDCFNGRDSVRLLSNNN